MTTNSGNCEHAARVIEAVLVMIDRFVLCATTIPHA